MHRRRTAVTTAIAVLAAGTLTLTAVALGGADAKNARHARHGHATHAKPNVRVQLDAAQLGAAGFLDVSAAKRAGYAEFRDAEGIACIEHPHMGAMGVHYVNGDLVGDAFLYPARPEALVYEPTGNGKLELVAHEYIVFQKAWDETHDKPPTLLGRRFRLIEKPNRYGLESFYELHAWLWKPNPAGMFADYNPRVVCPA